jgi:hypothetical protein
MAAMAYFDYFPNGSDLFFPNGSDKDPGELRAKVSQAIMKASPGFCGSFGPGANGAFSLKGHDSNDYDMSIMHSLPLAYRYYDDLPEVRERLITLLLARGLIHRPDEDDTFTSGSPPVDWSRAGHVSPVGVEVDIPETENHVLMIATARYLSNQLLYQRFHAHNFDNRRNGDSGAPSCFEVLLELLQNMLRDDFAEYNAKNYQEQTRYALNNLYTYAYDSEVRLAAQMVLDYISAHFAVSSDDLRRLVPFRRRDEGLKVNPLVGEPGFMDVPLLEQHFGADPMAPWFALLAGNTRGFEMPDPRKWDGNTPVRNVEWTINTAPEYVQGPFSDYRLPPSIHDLFVNDLHRRFFQRLHRFSRDEPGGQRNCDNMEIYAASPSYLITAGGEPATYSIPGFEPFHIGFDESNRGVAMPTSFMPTGLSAGSGTTSDAKELIQLSQFSDVFAMEIPASAQGRLVDFISATENYGVAPDFACGYKLHLPDWANQHLERVGPFLFLDKGSKGHVENGPPGFFLAIHRGTDQNLAFFEAFDTWLHPEVDYQTFKNRVQEKNPSFDLPHGENLHENQECVYTTQNGNRIHFVIWNNNERDDHLIGSKILNIEYGAGNRNDTLIDAGNNTEQYLSGTILNSPRDAVVEIINPFLGTKIILDMSNRANPTRTSETGEVEEGGNNHEVWLDFDSNGTQAGDFFRPFNTLAAAAGAVASGGVIKITPGTAHLNEALHINKRMTLVAPIGGVKIGLP